MASVKKTPCDIIRSLELGWRCIEMQGMTRQQLQLRREPETLSLWRVRFRVGSWILKKAKACLSAVLTKNTKVNMSTNLMSSHVQHGSVSELIAERHAHHTSPIPTRPWACCRALEAVILELMLLLPGAAQCRTSCWILERFLKSWWILEKWRKSAQAVL